MKNITLSADERLIEKARERARAKHTTLNEEFRRWLADYVGYQRTADDAMGLLRELQAKYTTGGHKFTRDELNEH
jgi:hypothetical protein